MNMASPFLKVIFWLILSITAGTGMAISAVYLYLAPTLPDAETLKEVDLQTPLRVFTADGMLITEFGEKRRSPINYEDIPPRFIDALLSAEDDGFFEHSGIDFMGLARAVKQLVTTGRKKSGGSTITMQVAKNYYLSSEKTFTRKFTEILLALKIEQVLSKEEILELYVNKIYLGKRAYGIEAASQVYYGKNIDELDLAQLAMIAGLPQAPSAANPINNPQRAVSRRNHVLARMYNLGKISQEEFEVAIREPVAARYHGATSEVSAPYVAEMVRQEMISRYGQEAYTAGFNVYTTVTSKRQSAANMALQNGLLQYDRDHGYRGPSGQIKPVVSSPGIPPEDVTLLEQLDASDDINWPETLELWEDFVLREAGYGMLRPAIVASVTEEGAWCFTAEGFTWLSMDGMRWAAPYLTVNSIGAAPETPADVLSSGDKIWLQDLKGQTLLAEPPEAEGALVSINPHDGAIQALVGGFSDANNQFNRVLQAERQPGSSFKPFIYSAALENGFTTASIINDAPVVFRDASLESTWRPENYSGKFYGPTRLRQALYRSQNLVSIRILKQMGPGSAVRHIRNFGFPANKLNKDLSLALGASAVTPLELATGYAVFANGGYLITPYVISRIETDQGELIYQANPALAMDCPDCMTETADTADAPLPEDNLATLVTASEAASEEEAQDDTAEDDNKIEPVYAERVLNEENRFLTVNMMQDVIRRGTGRKALSIGRDDLAGKTGTTNDQKDAWFSGFNPELVTTVWVGFDQPQTLGRWASGGGTALPIWIEYMEQALRGVPQQGYEQPEGIVTVRIDPETGLLAAPGQTDAIFEYFRSFEVPKEYARIRPELPTGDDGAAAEIIPEQLF